MNANDEKQIVNRQTVCNLFKMVPLIFMILATSGCGNKMEGVYVDPENSVKMTLKSDDTAYIYIELMGTSREIAATYKVDDKKLLLTGGGETLVFNIHDDGSFSYTDGFFKWHLKKADGLIKSDASAHQQKQPASTVVTEVDAQKGAQQKISAAMSQTSLTYAKILLDNDGSKVNLDDVVKGCLNTDLGTTKYKLLCSRSGQNIAITVTHPDFPNITESEMWINPDPI